MRKDRREEVTKDLADLNYYLGTPPYGSTVKGFMTREFDKQRGNDSRPSFRNKPANRNGDEQSPRPARPRLNRETVDRAWESGAQHTHADYRSRSNNGQPPRNNWRNQQPSGYSSSQNSHGGNRPYNNQRQEQYRDNPRRFERTPDENNGPRSRSFNSNSTGRRDYNDQHSAERRDYRERSTGSDRRPGYRDNRDNRDNRNNGQSREYGGQFRGRDQDRDYRRRDFGRDERGGQNFGRSSFETDRRDSRGYQGQRPGPDTRNPRGQSRPWEQRQTNDRPQNPYRPARPAYNERNERNERFEGDYERFEGHNAAPDKRVDAHRPERPTSRTPRERQHFNGGERDNREHTEERHVTRLPNGRVLKGPRPVQRKEAQFWAGISENTDDLIGHIPTPETSDLEDAAGETEAGEQSAGEQSAAPRKPRTRSASASVRTKKANTAGGGKRGPKPSQRGFKWPTPE